MRIFLLLVAAGLTLAGWSAHARADSPDAAKAATIRVYLPSDATLMIDGRPTKATSSVRLFVSPPLAAGKSFVYSITAQYTRDGNTITVKRDVIVSAGQESVVRMGGSDGIAAAAADVSTGTTSSAEYSRPVTPAGTSTAPARTPQAPASTVVPLSQQGADLNTGPPGSNDPLASPLF